MGHRQRRRRVAGPRAADAVAVAASDFRTLDDIVATLRDRARRTGHRAVLVLRPPGDAGSIGIERWRVAGHAARADAEGIASASTGPDRVHRVQAWLGTEHEVVRVVLAPATPCLAASGALSDPALIASALGTVRAGGLAILVVSRGPAPRSALARRLVEALHRAGRVPGACVATVDLPPDFGHRERESGRRRRLAPTRVLASPAVPSARALQAQNALFERALAALRAPRSTVVLIGARGRGKSALLGRLHDALGSEDPAAGALATAAIRGATASLVRHAGAPVRFVAPDAALRAPSATLLVDEAASLPNHVLSALLARHDRVVLATTVSGHEASGRALAVRLDRTLGATRVDRTLLEPVHAMRWREGDPLEAALDAALLLDALAAGAVDARVDVDTGADTGAGAGAGASDGDDVPFPQRARAAVGRSGSLPVAVRVRRVDPARWRADEGALRDLVRLLGAVHYQSALADLEHLLKGRFETRVAHIDDALAGVVLTVREGGIDPALGPAILAGRRRLPDQLLPQLLARAAGDTGALGASYARVVRIAVAPRARRLGVGSALLRDIAPGADAVGASFAAGDEATRFWLANGYRIVHEGSRVNPRSGTASRTVLRPVTGMAGTAPDGDAELGEIARAFVRRLAGGVHGIGTSGVRRGTKSPSS